MTDCVRPDRIRHGGEIAEIETFQFAASNTYDNIGFGGIVTFLYQPILDGSSAYGYAKKG